MVQIIVQKWRVLAQSQFDCFELTLTLSMNHVGTRKYLVLQLNQKGTHISHHVMMGLGRDRFAHINTTIISNITVGA